jgi:hypothetical protein
MSGVILLGGGMESGILCPVQCHTLPTLKILHFQWVFYNPTGHWSGVDRIYKEALGRVYT